MQYSDGVAHTLTFFEDTFTEIPVTAETYEAEKALGLYYTEGSLKIPPGTEEIVFTYYTPAGAFIERQNVFILKDGIQGEDGQPAPMYLGAFSVPPAARSDNTPLQANDTYLNKSDYKLYRYDGTDWQAVASDYDPGWWDALGDAVNIAAETGTQIEAANIWVQKLVAGTILAQRLFTQQLVLSENGQIKSANYQAGKSGFIISGTGVVEFHQGSFRGNMSVKNVLIDIKPEPGDVLTCTLIDMVATRASEVHTHYYSRLTCPISGTYKFTVIAPPSAPNSPMQIYKNGTLIHEVASGTSINISLNGGDYVYIRTKTPGILSNPSTAYAYVYSNIPSDSLASALIQLGIEQQGYYAFETESR